MKSLRFALGLLSLAATTIRELPARQPQAAVATPQLLADSILALFAKGDTLGFRELFPFEAGRAYLAAAVRDGHRPVAEIARVTRESGDSAVILLGGYVQFRSTGDETLFANDFSQLYRAARSGTGWHLTTPLRLRELTALQSHQLRARLQPGKGLEVVDSLVAKIQTPDGIGFHLNHAATVTQVSIDGRPVKFAFGGGVLWAGAPKGVARMKVEYSLDIARDSAAPVNSARFVADYGHIRGSYFWHPAVWFDDAATFRLTVEAPAEVLVATDLPQTESIRGDTRIVTAAGTYPMAALSLFYDRAWKPVTRQMGPARLTVFATPDFHPPADSLGEAFARVYRVLTTRFGKPSGAYLAVVQQRARPGEGWLFRSNYAIGAMSNGWVIMDSSAVPRASFPHEVSHGWTHPVGPGRMLLIEGWANYAAGLVVGDRFGPAVEARYWEGQRDAYLSGGFDGNARLSTDDLNGGVSYSKGAWLLRMLEREMGRDAFDRGFRTYMSLGSNVPPDYSAFKRSMSVAAGRDLGPFLDPWVEGDRIPSLSATIDNGEVRIHQEKQGVLFHLGVVLGLVQGTDTTRVTVRISRADTTVALPANLRRAQAVAIDPDHLLLIRAAGR